MIHYKIKKLKQMSDKELIDHIGNIVKEIAYQREILIRALKKIRDNEDNDLAEYAVFCENTAKEALKEVGL